MSTGYLGTTTSPDPPRVSDLERRVARLEGELERRDHDAEMRRIWRWYFASCAVMPVAPQFSST
ncbi:MAG: hypothetical protein ACR2KK_08395 [Acidimicrobiales bacterium]